MKGPFALNRRGEIPTQERNRGADQCTTTNPVKVALGVFLLPHIWILSTGSIALYLAAVLESKSAIGINDSESNAWIVGNPDITPKQRSRCKRVVREKRCFRKLQAAFHAITTDSVGDNKSAEALNDKQPIDRRIDHLYPTSRSYCFGVSKRSTLPRPVMMACSTACLEARSRSPLPRRIISTMLSGSVKVRGGAA